MAIKVAEYIISFPVEGKVWIHRMDAQGGEGGQFTVEQVQEALDEMWAKYF